MNQYVDFSCLAAFLNAIGSTGVAGLIQKLEERINKQTPAEWRCYYDEHRGAIDVAMNSLGGGRCLSTKCFKQIEAHMVSADRCLQQRFAIATGTLDGQDADHLKALHLLGVVSWHGEAELSPFFSPSLTMPILGYVSRMNEVVSQKTL